MGSIVEASMSVNGNKGSLSNAIWKGKVEDVEDLPHEVWKMIEVHPDHAVSNYGRVKNVKRNKILKANGYYLKVSLNGKNRTIHRLVASAFVENPEGKLHVDHIDGDREN